GYVGGAVAQATIPNVNAYGIMFGLGTNPTADGSFGSINYAAYITGSGVVQVFESGTQVASVNVAITNGDAIAVSYDGSNVRYLRNGVVFRTVPVAITVPLYFDSSFATPGAVLTNIRFMPQSSNSWVSIGGLGKPDNYATYGGTFGAGGNITGQMTLAQVPNFIPPNGITDSLIGGNLRSANWAGVTYGPGAVGWLLERDTGNFYGNSMRLRGYIMGGDYVQPYTWPVQNGDGSYPIGYYVGPEGALWGNGRTARYVQISAAGDMYANGFQLVNGQLTLTNTILIAPKYGDNVVGSISGGGQYYTVGNNIAFTDKYVGTYAASMTNSSGNLTFAWSTESSSGAITLRITGTSSQSCIVYATGRLIAGQELDMIVRCNIIDVTSNFTRNVETFFTIGSPS
ncbi:MAG: hypothetical protein M3Y65_17865, partial [Pseudomonadota bacterium]|nr:hypothetical protein [Pseudomonadota bacterium]